MKKMVNEDCAIFTDEDYLICLNLSNRCPSTIGLKDIDGRFCDSKRPCEECVKQAFDEVKDVELKLVLEDDESTSYTGRIESEPYEDDYEETITTDAIEDMFVYITKTYSREDIDYLVSLLNSYVYKIRTDHMISKE